MFGQALFLERIGDNWEIYLNGRLIRSEMFVSPDGNILKHRVMERTVVLLPESSLKEGENILVFHILGDPFSNLTGISFSEDSQIHDYEIIREYESEHIEYFLFASYFFIGLLSFLLFWKNRSELEYLFFTIFSVSFLFYSFSNMQASSIYLSDFDPAIRFLENSSLFLAASFMALFVDTIINHKAGVIIKLAASLWGGLALLVLTVPLKSIFYVQAIFGFSEIFPAIYFLFSITKQIRIQFLKENNIRIRSSFAVYKKIFLFLYRSDFGFLFISILVVIGFIIVDIIFHTFYNFHFSFARYSVNIFTLFMAFLVVRRYDRNRRDYIEEKANTVVAEKTARLEERRHIYADLHDHLGARLTDLSFQMKQLSSDGTIETKSAESLQNNINEIISGMRQQLYRITDLEKLSKNFVYGINLILLRRYNVVERELLFKADNAKRINQMFFGLQKEDKTLIALSGAIDEIVSNDLKYGKGVSSWKLSPVILGANNQPGLHIRMESDSIHTQETSLPGLGSQTIQQRISEIGGTVTSTLVKDRFSVTVEIPQNSPERAS